MAKLTIEIGAKIDKLKKGLANSQSRVRAWSRKISGITKLALGTAFVGFGAGIVSLIKKSAQLAAQFEQIKVAFTTMTGSADRARGFIEELNEFSKATPFSPQQVFKAGKTLLAFGFAAKDVSKTLRLLGNVSAGTGKDLGELSVIFGQIKGAGRLMGQDLLQLINAGFNPLQVMSKKTGKSMAELKDEMSKGAISFEMVEQAFRDATTEGGLFFNMMEKQSKTLNGQLSTLEGTVGDLMRNFGEGLLPELKSATGAMLELASAMGEVAEARKQITAGDVDVGQGMAADIGTLAVANLDDAIANVLDALPGESIIAKKLRERADFLRDAAMGGVETQAISEAQKREGAKKLQEKLEKEELEGAKKPATGLADDDFASADPLGDFFASQQTKFNRIVEDGERARFGVAKDAAKESAQQGINDLQKQGEALKQTIGNAFQPGGQIQSRLARIGGDRTIAVDRQIPQKQLDQLQQVNKGILSLKKSIESIDGLAFPGGN